MRNLTSQSVRDLATVILVAADMHEECYNKLRQANWEIEHPDSPPNYSVFHDMSLRESCEVAAHCGPLERPVYLLLTCCWNDALDWAKVMAPRNGHKRR